MMASISNVSVTPAHHNLTDSGLSEADVITVMRLKEIAYGIFVSYLWVIFFLGFPGNVICVVTVLTMTSLSTATLYVAILAVTDALTLLVKLVFNQMGYHQVYFGDHWCRAFILSNILNCYANWMLVLICFERFLAVCWPLKKAAFFTKSYALLIAAVLFGIIFFIYMVSIVKTISSEDGKLCGVDDDDNLSFQKGWHWFSSILFTFAPFTLIVVFTTLIITGLRKYRRARKSILGGNLQQSFKGEKRAESPNVERAISVMMSVTAVVFLLLTLPDCIFTIAYDSSREYSEMSRARWMLFRQVKHFLTDLNHAVNFYLYFLTADKFRSRFKDMVMCRRRHPRKKSETSVGEHTVYTRANSTENIAMARV